MKLCAASSFSTLSALVLVFNVTTFLMWSYKYVYRTIFSWFLARFVDFSVTESKWVTFNLYYLGPKTLNLSILCVELLKMLASQLTYSFNALMTRICGVVCRLYEYGGWWWIFILSRKEHVDFEEQRPENKPLRNYTSDFYINDFDEKHFYLVCR